MMTYCLALILAAAAQDDKEAEKAATEAFEQFQKAYKGTDDERKTAIDELVKVQHPKVATKLGAILAGASSSPVRVAANGTNPNQTGGVVVSGSNANPQRDRAMALVSAANTALQEITKEKLTTADAWSSWWAKNKATFNKK